MTYSKLFITGFDSTTAWMIPWFKKNFYQHMPESNLLAYNFDSFEAPSSGLKNWFKKPFAMQDAAKQARSVCWLDSDIEIKSDITDIFNYVEPNKLAMVEDRPWSARRGEKWHNSGVVAFNSRPNILDQWSAAVANVKSNNNPMLGDQDILHHLVRDGIKRMIHITDLPQQYNTLRLDVLDNNVPSYIKCMHWTGGKGKEHIRSLMND